MYCIYFLFRLDFLFCNQFYLRYPLQDIPSTGLDCWYKLEARTTRSNIQGKIRLKLWLSTREDRGTSEEDHWSSIRQQERLYSVFINYEMTQAQGVWSGEVPHVGGYHLIPSLPQSTTEVSLNCRVLTILKVYFMKNGLN